MQTSLQVKRAEMKMFRLCETFHIEIRHPQIGDRSWIGENVALRAVWEQHGDACRALCAHSHARDVNAALRKPLACKATERVVSDHTLKRNTHAHGRKVVRHNCRGAAESCDKVSSQKLPLCRHLCREAVKY